MVALAMLPPWNTTKTSPVTGLIAEVAEMVIVGAAAMATDAGSRPAAKAPAARAAKLTPRLSLDIRTHLPPAPAGRFRCEPGQSSGKGNPERVHSQNSSLRQGPLSHPGVWSGRFV